MGYIKNTLANRNQTVKGGIIATEEDQGLKNALSVTPDIDFYKYNINFTLNNYFMNIIQYYLLNKEVFLKILV